MKHTASDFCLFIIKPPARHDWVNRVGQLRGEVTQKLNTEGIDQILQFGHHFCSSELEYLYAEHVGEAFFPEHCNYMKESAVWVSILRATEELRQVNDRPLFEIVRSIIGATNALQAEPGTLRCQYGAELPRNSFHASSSQEAVKRELSFFYSGRVLLDLGGGDLL